MKYLPDPQNLNKLWQLVSTAGELAELTRDRRTYVFHTQGPITLYLRAENAHVSVARWALPRVEVKVRLEGKFGWRMAAEQDDAGVYIAAHRRPVVGELSSALFTLAVPHDTYLLLKLAGGRVTWENVSGTLHVPPLTQADEHPRLVSGG
jgi:hypothetical protein